MNKNCSWPRGKRCWPTCCAEGPFPNCGVAGRAFPGRFPSAPNGSVCLQRPRHGSAQHPLHAAGHLGRVSAMGVRCRPFVKTPTRGGFGGGRYQGSGNLGTLIRTAHWFGVQALVALNGCAELYNPKTIQSTMGSAGQGTRILFGCRFFFAAHAGRVPFYGADLEGELLPTFGRKLRLPWSSAANRTGCRPYRRRICRAKSSFPRLMPKTVPSRSMRPFLAGIILSRLAG